MCWYFDFAYPGCYHHALNFCVEPCWRGENSRFTGRRCPAAEYSEFQIDQDCPRCNNASMASNPLTAENDPDLPDDFVWHIPAIDAVNPGWRQIDWIPPPRDGPSADPDYGDPPSPRTVPANQTPTEPRQSSVATNIPEHELRRKPGRCPLKRSRSPELTEDERISERNITDQILKRPRLVQEVDDSATIMSDSMPPPPIPTRSPARLLSSMINRAKAPSPNATPSEPTHCPQPLIQNRSRPATLDLSLTTALRPNAHAIRARFPSSISLLPPLLLPSPLLPLSPLVSSPTATALPTATHHGHAHRSPSAADKVREVVRSLSNSVRKLSKVWRRLSFSVSAKITQKGKKNDTKGKDKAKSSSTSYPSPATPTRYCQGPLEREDELHDRAEVNRVVSKELERQKGKWDRVLGWSI